MNCGNELNCGVYAKDTEADSSKCNGIIHLSHDKNEYYNTSKGKYCGFLEGITSQRRQANMLGAIANALEDKIDGDKE